MTKKITLKIQLVVCVFLQITFSSLAQFTFQRVYNVAANTSFLKEVIPMSNKNYLVCGTLVSNGFYMMRVDSTGLPIWTKAINNPKSNYPVSFQKCIDGGVIMCGYVQDVNFNWDILLTRVDSLGTVVWTHAYGTTAGTDMGTFARQTSDGGFIVTGSTFISGTEVRQCLIKTNSLGVIQWQSTFASTAPPTINEAEYVTELSDGYVVCGRTQVFGTSSSNYDATLIRTDLNGNMIWAHSYGFGEWDQFNRVVATSDGGFLACGWVDTISGGNVREILFSKFNSAGTLQWSKTYGGVGDDIAWDMKQTTDGGFIAAGETTSFSPGMIDYYLLRMNSIGNLLWSKTYGSTGEDGLYTCLQTPDGGFIAGGRTVSFGSSSDNSYLVKTNFLGFSSCNELNTPPTVTGSIILPLISSSFLNYSNTIANYSITSTTSNKTTSASLLCSSNGVDELTTDNSIEVFPNPFTSELFVNFSDVFIKAQLTLFDICGKVMFTQESIGKSTSFNASNLSSGIYFLTVQTINGSKVKKVIKI